MTKKCIASDCNYCEQNESCRKMTVTEALELIVKNEYIPALNHCIGYTIYAKELLIHLGSNHHDFKVQLLYVLNNMSRWRQCKASTTTAAEIKECRAVLKKASL